MIEVTPCCVCSSKNVTCRYVLLVQDLERSLAGYFLEDIPIETRAIQLDNVLAPTLKPRSFTQSPAPASLRLKAGMKLKFFMVSFLVSQNILLAFDLRRAAAKFLGARRLGAQPKLPRFIRALGPNA